MVLFGIIEFAFALNAVLSIDFATREAALTAAEAGSEGDADCSILRAVQRSVAAPADNNRITEVRIFKSNASGDPLGPVNVYVRAGSPISCPLADGTPATLPYHRLSHTYDDRCSILAGCGGSTTVDTIGVQMTYVYDWKTPLHTLLPMAGTRLHDDQGERHAHGADPVTRDRRRSRGQAMVEYAISIPVFLLILLGMLEFGFAFSHHLTMEYATREGARAGAALANGSNEYPCAVVDNQVIAAVQRVITASGSQVDINSITQIRIYKASNTDGLEHPGDPVNVWTLGKGPVVDNAALKFKLQSFGWDPCQRKNAANPDHIGVSMNYGYHYVTPLGGLLGATGNPVLPMSDRTIMSLNPD